MPENEITYRIEDATISLDYLYDYLAEREYEDEERDIRYPEEYYGF